MFVIFVFKQLKYGRPMQNEVSLDIYDCITQPRTNRLPLVHWVTTYCENNVHTIYLLLLDAYVFNCFLM